MAKIYFRRPEDPKPKHKKSYHSITKRYKTLFWIMSLLNLFILGVIK